MLYKIISSFFAENSNFRTSLEVGLQEIEADLKNRDRDVHNHFEKRIKCKKFFHPQVLECGLS